MSANRCSVQKDVLDRFGDYSGQVAQLLEDGDGLTTEEQLFLENQLLIVQLALAMAKHRALKRRHVPEGQ